MKNILKILISTLLITSLIFTTGVDIIEQGKDTTEIEKKEEKLEVKEAPKKEEVKEVIEEEVKEEPKEEPKEEVEEKVEEPEADKAKSEKPKEDQEDGKTEAKEEVEAEEAEEGEEEEVEEVEELKGTITIKVQNSNSEEFDIFIKGSNGSLYTVSLKDGHSITLENLELGDYKVSTIVPMNYKLDSITSKSITISEDILDEETTLKYSRTNTSWFYSQ